MNLVVTPRFRILPTLLLVLPAILLGATFEHPGSAESPCPVGAAAEIHYSPAEDLESIDVALIGEAAKQIDMAAYVLTDRAVVEALRAAAGRGVQVRIWRDASEAARLSEFDIETQLGGRVAGLASVSAPGGELMHLKGYRVDHRLLRTGSANFSRSGEARQDNDIVVLRGVSVCAGFGAKFERGWNRT